MDEAVLHINVDKRCSLWSHRKLSHILCLDQPIQTVANAAPIIPFPTSLRGRVSRASIVVNGTFPGQPILAHWPYNDPSKVQGIPEEVEAAYFRVASRIRYRLQLFNNLSFDQLDRLRIEVKMKNLVESS